MSELLNNIFDIEETEHSELYDVMRKLISAEDDVDLKTEIKSPEKLAVLRMIGDQLEQEELHESSKTIRDFVNYSMRHAFSKDRKSRREIIEAMKTIVQSEQQQNENDEKSILKRRV